MPEQSLPTDIVSVFSYRRRVHRAECTCGMDGKRRFSKTRAIIDALLHAANTGHREHWPLVYTAAPKRGANRLALVSLTAAMAILGAALYLSAPAHADTNDDIYLAVLSDQGITHTSGAAGLIAMGHEVCRNRALGYTEMQIAHRLYLVSQLNNYDSGYVVGAAEAAYCPGYASTNAAANAEPTEAPQWSPKGSMGGRL